MKVLRFLIFLLVVITVNSEIIEEESYGKSKLPILLRTLRLRTFSLRDGEYDYVPRVQLKQLRLRPTFVDGRNPASEEVQENDVESEEKELPIVKNIERRSLRDLEGDGEEEERPRNKLPGWGMIGGNRHQNIRGKFLKLRPTTFDNENPPFEDIEDREYSEMRNIEKRSVDLEGSEEEKSSPNDLEKKQAKIEGDDEEEKFKAAEAIEGNDDNSEDVKLPGRQLIGRHRHPKHHGHKVLPYPVPRLDRRKVKPFWKHKFPCTDNQLTELKRCFASYFENIGLSLTEDKLPSIVDVHEKMSEFEDYDQNKEFHENFRQCYKSIPNTCFESKNLKKIILNPSEKNVYSSFFTFSEFIFKDRKYEKQIDCFLSHLEFLPSIEEEDSDEVKVEKCRTANLAIQKARDEYRRLCITPEASEIREASESEKSITSSEVSGSQDTPKHSRRSKFSKKFKRGKCGKFRDHEMDQWFVPFIKRQSVGEFCPPLFTNRKALPFRIY